MPTFTLNACPKPSHKRNKPLARQRGAISPKIRKQLKERSGGACERSSCGNEAVHAAHITRRWKLQETTVKDLLHLCIACHTYADTTREGREWLEEFRMKLLAEGDRDDRNT